MLKEFTSGWQRDKVLTINTEGLTDNEVAVMIASRTNDFSDIYESGGDWSFGVCDESHLDEKVYRGVVSSLIKKGLAGISDEKKVSDRSFWLTDAGKALFGVKEATMDTEASKAPSSKSEKATKSMSTAELVAFAESCNIDWKKDNNEPINRMRVTMALKKAHKYIG